MKKINKSVFFPLIALIVFICMLSRQMFTIPPLGKLLDPFIGAVQNNNNKDFSINGDFDCEGLRKPVNVFFDSRLVPHIYASNEDDLYFMQGYVTAKMRLWEMDFLTYVSAGRLSEIIIKDGILDYDRNQRRVGMLEAAKKSLVLMEKDPETKRVLTAYSKGVNAYINQLSYKTIPLEYKLLDYTPEAWSNLKTVLIIKQMASDLSGYEQDFCMSKLYVALGKENFNKLFPEFPIDFCPVMNRSKPDQLPSDFKGVDYLNEMFLSSVTSVSPSMFDPKLGSNSWAVSGKKTKSGFPILCSDPHLKLSLPSIWIEMQLSAPNMNVYGVSIPGTPAIIIGFNENIAWGLTNGNTDVKDWYKLEITNDYKKYQMDGTLMDLNFRIEEIKRKDDKSYFDTIYSTIQGPVVVDKNFKESRPELLNHALRWELQNPSNEIKTFIELNRASNYDGYKNAIKSYSCPVQNFTFACNDNTIAINHQGKLTLKWNEQGRFILDGTKSSHLYSGYIPQDSLPHLLNPACNYIMSANQHPTYSDYPYYYNGYFIESRANRIEKLLSEDTTFNIIKMMKIQTDDINSFAQAALPLLMQRMNYYKPNLGAENIILGLKGWKCNYNYDNKNPLFFELWWKYIKENSFDELKRLPYAVMPYDYVVLDLIKNTPDDNYFDKVGTVKKEIADDIIFMAFEQALKTYNEIKSKGSIVWGEYNKINLLHLTKVSAFSRLNLVSAGSPNVINATFRDVGPSWRMIVELGKKPIAYGIYPGGQSGTVGNQHYDDFVDDWNIGKYYKLNFFMSPVEAKSETTVCWHFK